MSFKAHFVALLIVFFTLLSPALSAEEDVPLNQIQVLHAHNSYHIAPNSELLDMLNGRLLRAILGESRGKELSSIVETFQTTYANLTELLNVWAVRSFEIDCFYDPNGGLFTTPAAPELASYEANKMPKSMFKPGWKVLHIPDLDFETTCYTVKDCLNEIRNWSIANSEHIPIFISLEPSSVNASGYLSEGAISALNAALKTNEGGPQELVKTEPINKATIKSLMEEILEVFSPDEIIYPQELIANGNTLAKSILNKPGWPLLSQLRGRVLFIISPPYTDEILKLYPKLKGSPVFPSAYAKADAGEDTVFLAIGAEEPGLTGGENTWDSQVDALSKEATKAVDEGYIIRAFADYSTQEARVNYIYRRDSILKTGAHLIATDYPSGYTSQFFDSSYSVILGDRKSAICNIRTSDKNCTSVYDIKPLDQPVEKEEDIKDSESNIDLEMTSSNMAPENILDNSAITNSFNLLHLVLLFGSCFIFGLYLI